MVPGLAWKIVVLTYEEERVRFWFSSDLNSHVERASFGKAVPFSRLVEVT